MKRNHFTRLEVEDPIRRIRPRQMPPSPPTASAAVVLAIMVAIGSAALGITSLLVSKSSKEAVQGLDKGITDSRLLDLEYNGTCLIADKTSILACNISSVDTSVLLVFCWDLNGNGACDAVTEDTNKDGNCTIDDCKGRDGINGTNGAACWDIDANGVCSVNEDINLDGNCTYLDCQGTPGLSCWDKNKDKACNLFLEDINNDGRCDTLDCVGARGEKGDPIKIDLVHNFNETIIISLEQSYPSLNITGAAFYYVEVDSRSNISSPVGLESNQTGNLVSFDGLDWTDFGPFTGVGIDGHNCWDTNQDYLCTLLTEDINNDGVCNVTDCLGAKGSKGDRGTNCWDLDNSGTCNITTEDKNNDGNCTVLDCLGQTGQQGSPGINGVDGKNGTNGTDGFNCWDLDQNHQCDLITEDKNNNSICDVGDCIGPQGIQGITGQQGIQGIQGNTGPQGTAGLNGTMCWDLNNNNICDLGSEDINADTVCNVTDCKGPKGDIGSTGPMGTNGTKCWDLNSNSVCDIGTEDINGNGMCDIGDCKGATGEPFKVTGTVVFNDTFQAYAEQYRAQNNLSVVFYIINLDSRSNMSLPAGLSSNLTGHMISYDGTTWSDLGIFTGVKGDPGLNCWDLNSNAVCNILTEDKDGNGICDASDCRGVACWDLNGDGFCNITPEDTNFDGQCTVADCSIAYNAPSMTLDDLYTTRIHSKVNGGTVTVMDTTTFYNTIYASSIQPNTTSNGVTIDGIKVVGTDVQLTSITSKVTNADITLNSGTGKVIASSSALATTTIQTNTIQNYTSNGVVTIMSSSVTSDGISTVNVTASDTVTSSKVSTTTLTATSATATTITTQTIIATGDITLNAASGSVIMTPATKLDSITSRVTNADITISAGTGSVIMSSATKLDSITSRVTNADITVSAGTGSVIFPSTVKLDTIASRITNANITVNAGTGMLVSQSTIYAPSIITNTITTGALTSTGTFTANIINATQISTTDYYGTTCTVTTATVTNVYTTTIQSKVLNADIAFTTGTGYVTISNSLKTDKIDSLTLNGDITINLGATANLASPRIKTTTITPTTTNGQITIGSSGTTQITGTLQAATVSISGDITLTAGSIILTNHGISGLSSITFNGATNSMTSFDNGSIVGTFTGAYASSRSITLLWQLEGKVVTISTDQANVASCSTATTISSASVLPSALRPPSGTREAVINIQDNNANTYGTVKVSSTGTVTFSNGAAGSFTAGANCGPNVFTIQYRM